MRPLIHETMMHIAVVLAMRACCIRRRVGCVLADEDWRVVGTGYNGRIAGVPNCHGDEVCIGHCEGMHAEINALLHTAGQPCHAIVTTMPCLHCVKALLAAGVDQLVVLAGPLDDEQRQAQELWKQFGKPILELRDAASAAMPLARA